jgi:hypothetical protein
MKMNAGLLVATFFMTLGCASESSQGSVGVSRTEVSTEVLVTDADSHRNFNVATGQNVVVKLRDQGDGGFVWSVLGAGGLGGGVKTHEADPNVGPGPIVGNFGFDVFTFTTTNATPGVHVVELVDRRPFGNDPGVLFVFTVTVTE